MANPHRGEVGFLADGKAYTMVYTINSLCELEEETGKGVDVLAADLEAPSISLVRTLFWAGLRARHPEITVTAAGEIIDTLGFPEVSALIERAFNLTFPEAPKGSSRPPKASSKARVG